MGPRLRSIRSEVAGYFAALAFLGAYLLSVMDKARPIEVGLNLIGAAVAATYLYKKNAFPSVISNIAWFAITIGGLVGGERL